jgi:hypothetical protein
MDWNIGIAQKDQLQNDTPGGMAGIHPPARIRSF